MLVSVSHTPSASVVGLPAPGRSPAMGGFPCGGEQSPPLSSSLCETAPSLQLGEAWGPFLFGLLGSSLSLKCGFLCLAEGAAGHLIGLVCRLVGVTVERQEKL